MGCLQSKPVAYSASKPFTSIATDDFASTDHCQGSNRALSTTGLVNLPEELLMMVLEMLDFDTVQLSLRSVNSRFYDLSSSSSLNRRLTLPESVSTKQITKLISSQLLQDHLQYLYIGLKHVKLREMYELLHKEHVTLASLRCISVETLSGFSDATAQAIVMRQVTPHLQHIKLRGDYHAPRRSGKSSWGRLFVRRSCMSALTEAFPALHIHIDLVCGPADSEAKCFDTIKLYDSRLHGMLTIHDVYSAIRIPFDTYREQRLMDVYVSSREQYISLAKQHATSSCFEIADVEEYRSRMVALD